MKRIDDILTSFFVPAALNAFGDFQDQKEITIEEPQNTEKSQLRSVTIKGFQQLYVAVKMDIENLSFTGNLVQKGDFKKSCDALLFGRVANHDYVFIVELRSNVYTMKEVECKFWNTEAVLEYLRTLCQRYPCKAELPSFENKKIIPILFDRKETRGPMKYDERGTKYIHQGFSRQNNTTDIRNIITKW